MKGHFELRRSVVREIIADIPVLLQRTTIAIVTGKVHLSNENGAAGWNAYNGSHGANELGVSAGALGVLKHLALGLLTIGNIDETDFDDLTPRNKWQEKTERAYSEILSNSLINRFALGSVWSVIRMRFRFWKSKEMRFIYHHLDHRTEPTQ